MVHILNVPCVLSHCFEEKYPLEMQTSSSHSERQEAVKPLLMLHFSQITSKISQHLISLNI